MGRISSWWNQYRYRFVPWIALNLKNRSMRRVERNSCDKILPDEKILATLQGMFTALHGDEPQKPQHTPDVSPDQPHHGYARALAVMEDRLGFCIEKRPSIISGGGTGVLVTRGRIPKHTVVAMYPGVIYRPFEPILIQSIANPFIFRCIDKMLIDGNDQRLSRLLYRSCAGRDRFGPYELSDSTWLTSCPKNPLAIGQYVNNQTKETSANVLYQECDLPPDFPIHLRQYVPNITYTATDLSNYVRLVILLSVREIDEGEEILSSYFTVVH